MGSKKHGKNGAPDGRRRGGVARAKALTPKRRSEVAGRAARARWDPTIPEVECGGDDRPLRIGNLELACYVLTDGRRVFSQRGMIEALGLSSRGGELVQFVDQLDLRRHLSPEAAEALANPIEFRPPGGGRLAYGYPATLLIDFCNAILQANSDELPNRYRLAVTRAYLIVRAVAKVGIVALVDEATGYDERRKETLQALLDSYLRKELAIWAKRFPDAFYEQIFRLRGWTWRGRGVNPPGVVAYYTKDLVYARLAPGILPELERRNPIVGKYRKGKHTQLLTDDIGIPALAQHLHTVVALLKGSDSWEQLMTRMVRALPRQDENLALPLLEWDKDRDA